jgi:hypothetical protein
MAAPRKVKWSKDRPVKPDIDPLLTKLRTELAMDRRSFYAKANTSGLAPATIKNIQDGTTRRPMGVTIQMAYRMLGYELKPVRSKTR